MIAKFKLYWPFAAFLILVLVWAIWAGRSCATRHQVAQQTAQADQHHDQAITQAAQGAAHDQEAQAQAGKVSQDAQLVARLRAELARLRARPVQPPSDPGTPAPEPVTPSPDPVLVAADAVIAAQDQQIQDQVQQITTLTLSRDSWKTAYDASSKETVALRLALDAQKGAARAQRWQGRIEGLVVGLGVGYVGGKIL